MAINPWMFSYFKPKVAFFPFPLSTISNLTSPISYLSPYKPQKRSKA